MNSHALLPPISSLPESRPRPATSRVNDAYAHLLDAIIEQRLPPDSRLSEERLGLEFGVSRLQIRHALTLLAYQQVIILQARACARVASPSDEQLREALHARRLTEMALIPMACRRAQRHDVEHLHSLLDYQQQSRAGNQRGAAIRLAGAFHLHVAHMAGNAPLAYFLSNLIPMTSLAITRRSNATQGWHQQSAIANAVANRDEATALALLNQYLDDLMPA
ncbi:GntR family transcriptional regulator [Pseudomonas sp. 7P_10.2_Bac1]|uniref:GntR family transcriptional regulator n=1 Tax=Pseudomonas sp. 7P_10.2_Bac1 TaxID=2971614 RepID=UPI0021CAADDC|nr:GntR family transcriptional regulator [Pseudomonas sp. 7P_10.2_Bac1]MCU1727673.1 GntR family transcriptional regulator [Pseudomonas sp. 7P_10.2_Bac1]